ncbi:hypothetical protein ACFL6U_19215 [Planctomycetota bacterium]
MGRRISCQIAPSSVFALLGFILLSNICGCANKFVFTSTPDVATAENEWFRAQWQPEKKGRASFVAFRLTIENKTTEELVVDWNRTQYLLNGRTHGVLLFETYEPGYLRGTTTVLETIPAAGRLEKVTAPAEMVAFSPVKYQDQIASEDVMSPGPIPAGRSGIRLVVVKGEQETTKDIYVAITEKRTFGFIH